MNRRSIIRRLREISPINIISIITFIDLSVITFIVISFPWEIPWSLPSFQVGVFWAFFSIIVTFSTTRLPHGHAIASVGDLVDVAGIAIAGPIPIIIANVFACIVIAFKEGGSRIQKLPFNIVLWILAPMLSALVYHSINPPSEGSLSVQLSIAIIATFLCYSLSLLSHVSVAIAVTDHISLMKVIRENYLYTEIVSFATIPISIIMVIMWRLEGIVGVGLLAAPLLLLSIGLRGAFERGKLHERIKRDNQLTELGKSAASIMHEVEKPLSRIVMDAEYYLSNQFEPIEHMTRILEWAKEAGVVTRELLSALAGQLHLTILNPILIIEKVIRAIPQRDRARIQLIEPYPRNLVVHWDNNGVELVISNIVKNALEADSSSKIEIKLQVISKRKWLRQTPISVKMTISDNGPGLIHISADDLFNPLFSTKTGGRGLGLFISRQIVIAHGGILIAQDRYPQGAIFKINLPMKPKSYDLM